MILSRLPIEGLRRSSLRVTAVASEDAVDEACWLVGCALVSLLEENCNYGTLVKENMVLSEVYVFLSSRYSQIAPR